MMKPLLTADGAVLFPAAAKPVMYVAPETDVLPSCHRKAFHVLVIGARFGGHATLPLVVAVMRSLLLFGVLLVAATTAHGMTIAVQQEGIRTRTAPTPTVIRMSGPIERGDAEALRRTLAQVKSRAKPAADGPLATVEFSSHGGDVFEGVAIGYLLREFLVGTMVRSSDVCFSSCALAFLGGSAGGASGEAGPWRTIEPGGQVGFHNVWLNQHGLRNSARKEPGQAANAGFEVARAGASLIVRYTVDMGVDATFASRVLGRPTEQFEYIATPAIMVELQTCLSEPVPVTASAAQQAENICGHATGGAVHSTGARQMTLYEARLMLLREVERHGARKGGRSQFTERFHDVVESRLERPQADLYAGLRGVGLPLPDLAGDLYDVTLSGAGGATSCKVSLPKQTPDSYDLVIVGHKGLSAPLHSAPERCRWLARHAPGEVINPARHAGTSTLAEPPSGATEIKLISQ